MVYSIPEELKWGLRKRKSTLRSGNFKLKHWSVLVRKPIMSYFPFLGVAGWVGRDPAGIKEFYNPPFLAPKARHPVIQESIIMCNYELLMN